MPKGIVETDLPKISALLEQVIGHSDYTDIQRMGGLTNRTYRVSFADGVQYVLRIPGEGTEEMIVRDDEHTSTNLACSLGIDAQLLYFGKDGAKVTEFVPGAVTMSADTMKEPHRIQQAAALLRKLHSCGENTGVPFEVFDMAAGYEKIISDNNVPMFDDYTDVKATVMAIKQEVDAHGEAPKVPCHNDPLCENWVVSDADRLYLIDWEYAGINDGMWDVADVSIEAGYGHAEDAQMLAAYLGREPESADWKHLLASKLYVDYLWTLWAKTRVPFDGQSMEDWAAERYARLKNNIAEFRRI